MTSGEAGWVDAIEVRDAPRASFGPISTMTGVDFGSFLSLQAESAPAFLAFVENQPVEVIGQVAKGELRFGTGQADGANEQPEPVLLMGEDMFDMRTDR